MDQFKEPEIYDKLRSLDIADLDPSEFGEGELLGHMLQGVVIFGITASGLDKPLNGEKCLLVLRSVDRAVTDAAKRRSHNSDKTPAAQTLSGVRILSSLLMSTTRPKDMEEGPATAYLEGHCSNKHYYLQTLKNVGVKSPVPTTSICYDNEGGPLLRVFDFHPNLVLRLLTFPRGSWTRVATLQTAEEDTRKSLTRQLAKKGRHRQSLMLSTNYSFCALAQYRTTIGQITDGITQKGIHHDLVHYIFRDILMTRRVFLKDAAPKILAAIKSLGADKVAKAEESISATHARLRTAQKAVVSNPDHLKELEKLD